MHLIDAAGHVNNQFVHEDPATNRPPTEIDAAWLNAMQNELANAIVGLGIDLNKGDQQQLFKAIQKAIPGAATTEKAGVSALATVDDAKEGLRGDVVVTPEGLSAALDGAGGLPRFTPYLWSGRGDAMPEGDTQSSGQQLLDLMYPTMRADVQATQFNCTEAEWQASPMKRLTHWSLGEAGWMRPPDKNCVQPGSVGGGFYGAGVGSQSALLGTAVLDSLQGHAHEVHAPMSVVSNTSSGQVPMNNGALARTNLLAQTIVSDGANGDPRIAAVTKPRTWYGIWMIRMYGRVTNPGGLNAPALNARLDMVDARVAALEGQDLGVSKQKWVTTTATRLRGVPYVADQTFLLRVEVNVDSTSGGGTYVTYTIDGEAFIGGTVPYGAGALFVGQMLIPKGATFSFQLSGTFVSSSLKVREFRRAA